MQKIKTNRVSDSEAKSTSKEPANVPINYGAFLLLVAIFTGSLLYLYFIYLSFPSLEEWVDNIFLYVHIKINYTTSA